MNKRSINFSRFSVCTLTLLAALALALPAQADIKISQDKFVADCNSDGLVIVPPGNKLEVLNDGGQGLIKRDCTVQLGDNSELQLGERTNLLFRDGSDSGTYYNFEIKAPDTGFGIELQVKKNSRIEAKNFTVDMNGLQEAEAQFEENLCLVLKGNLTVSMNAESDEGGELQIKKYVATPDTPLCSPTNIIVAGGISIVVGGLDDSQIQIEEYNQLAAQEGDIVMTGNGGKSQIQIKKNVILNAGGDITLKASDAIGEVQVEEGNIFTAGDDITLDASGAGGKLNVKKDTVLNANDTITLNGGGECKIEADTGDWTGNLDLQGGCLKKEETDEEEFGLDG